MTTILQIPPRTIPVIDGKGFMTDPWYRLFQGVITRAGGIEGALQPEDATLTALAALDATPGVVKQTGADTFAKTAGVTATKTPPASITVVDGIVTAIS